MNGSTRPPMLALIATFALALGQAAPAFAADAMAGAPMDCSKADAMMMPSMHSDSAMHDSAMHEMKPTGNVDKDFATMMMSHNSMMMSMAHAEVSCGKDPKAKALAQKALDQAAADSKILQDILQNDAKI